MDAPDCFDCEEAFRRLDDFVDRELTEDEIDRVMKHLQICEACAEGFGFEGSLLREVREKINQVAIPPDLREKVFKRLQEKTK